MSPPAHSPALTLPFSDEKLYRSLQLAAARLGRPVLELVEAAITNELARLDSDLDRTLERIVRRLPTHQRPSPEVEAAAFARAEVMYPDPLQARRIETEEAEEAILGRLVG